MTIFNDRRALLVAAVAAFGLVQVSGPAVAGAKPSCSGKPATIVGGKRADTLRSKGQKADVIVARGGNDRIFAGGGRDIVCAGPGDDVVSGGKGRDHLDGAGGRETFLGGPGSDKLLGRAGDDAFFGGPGGEFAVGGLGNDRIYGQQQDDTLRGSDGQDLLIGEHGNDGMYGEAGDDWLRGDTGPDDYYGGPGHDTASFATASGVFLQLGEAKATTRGENGPSGNEPVTEIERVLGSSAPDQLYNSGGGSVDGLGFAYDPTDPNKRDVCDLWATVSCGPFPGPEDARRILLDAAGPDPGLRLLGSSADDTLTLTRTSSGLRVTAAGALLAPAACSGGGGTTVDCPFPAEPGYVYVDGGGGSDQIAVANSVGAGTTVLLNGGAGSDTIRGGPGNEILDASSGVGIYVDGAQAFQPSRDILLGGGGDDAVIGDEVGPDILKGEGGTDQLVVIDACAGHLIDGGPGGSDIAGFAPNDLIGLRARIGGYATTEQSSTGRCLPSRVSAANEILEGSGDADVLIGNGQNNHLIIGHEGNDILKGLGGHDRLRGDEGADTLLGGPGRDVLEARDRQRDRRLDCGPGGSRAIDDRADPSPLRCRNR